MDLTKCIVFLGIIAETLGKISFKGCLKENTYGYGYLEFFPVELLSKPAPESVRPHDSSDYHYIEFYVKAQSNAHIFLGQTSMRGYEIVLGGRNNTFSQIRLVNGNSKRSVQTEKTKGIVSDLETRGFWTSCDSSGFVSVGTLNSSEPILRWRNSNNFQINSVSFSTWTNIRGEWHFACSNTSISDLTDEDRNITANQRLRSDLFSYYNPSNYPKKDGEPTENVELHLEANYFHLNEKSGELQISGMTNLKWKDWKLIWNETDYEGIDVIHITPSEIWTPNIYVINSVAFEKKSPLSRSRKVVINKNGVVTWRTTFHSTTYCLLRFENWPFDTHNCSLTFGFLTEPINIDFKNMVVSKNYKSKWDIQDVYYTGHPDRYSPVHILFRRRDEPEIRILMIPSFLCAAILSLLSFGINPHCSTKLIFNCLSVFILILTVVALADDLPIMISPMPKIVHLYTLSIVVMCLPILLFIGLIYIPSNIVLPKFLSSVLNSRICNTLCCITSTLEIQPEIEESANNAVRLSLFIERLVFLIYFTTLVIPFVMNFQLLIQNN